MEDEQLIEQLAGMPEERVLKAVLNAAARKKLSDSDYAYIDSKGGRHLPINDADHVRNALARFDQTQFESEEAKATAKEKITAAAKKFGVEVGDEDEVAKAEPAGIFVTIEKADLEEGVIYGVASVANVKDRQGDVIRPDVLRKAAHEFLASRNGAFDDTHGYLGGGDIPGKLVESWMDGDRWRIGFRPDDIEVAKAAANGEYVGFSIEGLARRVEVLP